MSSDSASLSVWCVAAVMLWGSLGLVGCGDDAVDNAQICTEEFAGDECAVFELVNRERAQAGVPALRFDVELAHAARDHARDMVTRRYFSHVSPEGETFSQRVSKTSYEGFARAENIAYGQSSPQEVMQGWMESPGHRDNILKPDLTALGVGLDATHWVQVFGRD